MTAKSNQRTSRDPMQCPACGSRHTASAATTYSFTRRVYRGDVQSDVMPRLLAPPERKSEVIGPTLICGLIFAVAYPLMYWLALDFEGFVPDLFGIFDSRLVWPPLILSVSSCLFMVIRAGSWNQKEYPKLVAEWHSTAICRRCSHQFQFKTHTGVEARET